MLLFLILTHSCSDSDQIAITESVQEETKGDENQEIIVDQQLLGPNEIVLRIKILGSASQGKEICGLSKEHVFHVEVIEVVESGGSVSQKISKNHQMDVAFLFQPEQFEADISLEVKAKEGLCPDASSTYFTIIEHKILE
ncbi:hypothetical protein [Flagellimonas nanhaiensis]|nr:hypothetical protein [Allomuricauda nanhaiensis]